MSLVNFLYKRKFDKFFAKKIIIAPLFSIENDHRFFPNVIRKKIKAIDENIQQWALAKSDIFSESDWREIQLNKLKNILVHAGLNVPYWRKLFKKISFNPENFRDFEDLRKIPIITRADIKKIPIEELTAKNIPHSRFIEASTSGSTGEPLKLFQDARDIFRRRVSTYETIRYMGFSSRDKICMIDLRLANGLKGLGLRILPADLESPRLRQDKIYPLLTAYQPQILLATSSYLDRFLSFCQKDNFFLKIKAIVYIGESLNSNLRDHLENFFSAKVFSAYGAREASPLAIQCNKQGLHVAPWMNYLEIIDENGNSSGNGRAGEIIVTSLENEVMPFIRYQIGDSGKLNSGQCECGRQTKLIEFEGRVLGNIKFADGSAYPVSYVVHHFSSKYFSRIKRFQIEQNNLASIIIRYIPYSNLDCAQAENDLKKYFSDKFKNKIQVIFQKQDYIFPNSAGKTPIFISNIQI